MIQCQLYCVSLRQILYADVTHDVRENTHLKGALYTNTTVYTESHSLQFQIKSVH